MSNSLKNPIANNLFEDYIELFDKLKNENYSYDHHFGSKTKKGEINFIAFFDNIKKIIKIIEDNNVIYFYFNEFRTIIDSLEYEKFLLLNYFVKNIDEDLKKWYMNDPYFFIFLNSFLEINQKINNDKDNEDFILFIKFLRNIYFHFELTWRYNRLIKLSRYIEDNFDTKIWSDLISKTTKQQFEELNVVTYKGKEFKLIDSLNDKIPTLFQFMNWNPLKYKGSNNFAGFRLRIKGNFIIKYEEIPVFRSWDLYLHYSDIYEILNKCNEKLLDYLKFILEKSIKFKKDYLKYI